MPTPASKFHSGTPVGSYQPMPSRGTRVTLADGSEWLRTGTVVAAAPYPQAQLVEHLRAHIFSETASAVTVSAKGVATNGAGTYVVAGGSSTTVLVSTDYGVTWTTANHNMGGGVGADDVCWTGSRFICAGNANPNLKASSSTDGLTWTASLSVTTTGYTDSTTRVCGAGANVVVVAQSNSPTEGIWTSPTGLSGAWTARSPGAALNGQPEIDAHGNTVVIFYTSTASQRKSLDGGATWSLLTLGASAATGAKPLVLNGMVVAFTGDGAYIYSTDSTLVAWAVNSFSLPTAPIQVGRHFKTPAGRAVLPTTSFGVVYTDDGVEWKQQSLKWWLHTDNPLATTDSRFCCDDVTSFVCLGTAAARKPRHAQSTFATSNGIGVANEATTGSSGSPLYVKVK